MAHKYTLNRNIDKDLREWLPDEVKVKVPEQNTIAWINTMFSKYPSGIDHERSIKVCDMYYGISDGVPRTLKSIGDHFDRTESWAGKQRDKVLFSLSKGFAYGI